MDWLKELHKKLHEQGIELWFVRDPIKKAPSVSLTMLIISFNLYLFTMVNKLAGWFSNIDGAEQLLIISASLYFGRSITGKKATAKIDEEKK